MASAKDVLDRAKILAENGEIAKAKKLYQAVIDRMPDSDFAKSAQEALDGLSKSEDFDIDAIEKANNAIKTDTDEDNPYIEVENSTSSDDETPTSKTQDNNQPPKEQKPVPIKRKPMKKSLKIVLIIIGIVMVCVIVLCVYQSKSSTKETTGQTTSSSESSSQNDLKVVTSGSAYNTAKGICSDVSVMANDNQINYDFSKCDDVMNGDGYEFMWHAARLLEDNPYESIGFDAFNDDMGAMLTITKYKGLGSFNSDLTLLEGMDSSWQSYYDFIFGAHDGNYQYEKSLKEIADENGVGQDEFADFEYKTDEALWFYATFDKGAGHNFDDSNYSYAVIYGYNNTENDGKVVARIARRALDNYTTIRQFDETLFPKKIIAINVDNVTGLVFTNKGDSWDNDFTESPYAFLRGYNKTINE